MQVQYARRVPAQKVSMRCNGPRRDLLGRDQDILLRDETRDALDRDEMLVRLETETSQPRPHPWRVYSFNRADAFVYLAAEECVLRRSHYDLVLNIL